MRSLQACAQLQAALSTLQDQSKLRLPAGVQQDMDSVWAAAQSATLEMSASASTLGQLQALRQHRVEAQHHHSQLHCGSCKGDGTSPSSSGGVPLAAWAQRPRKGPAVGSGAAAAAAAAAVAAQRQAASKRSPASSGAAAMPSGTTAMYDGAVYDDDAADAGSNDDDHDASYLPDRDALAASSSGPQFAWRMEQSPLPGGRGQATSLSRLYSSEAEPFRLMQQVSAQRGVGIAPGLLAGGRRGGERHQ
jgi:hypothetical protein